MFLDLQSEFSSAQDIGQVAGSYVSTNVIDAGVADADPGLGEPNLFIYAAVTEAVASAGAATVQIQVWTDNDVSFATEKLVVESKAYSVAEINGSIPPLKLPIGLQRYTRLKYVVGAFTTTAGTITAGLVRDIQRNHAFPTRIL